MSKPPLPLSRRAPEAAGLSASLVHASGWPALSITDSPQTVELEFVNRTPLPIEAGPAMVRLAFRPGVLEQIETMALAPQSEAQWLMTVTNSPGQGGTEVIFAGVERFVLRPGEAHRIRIDGVHAAEGGGSRATRVEFGYGDLFHTSGVEITGKRLIHLPILRRHAPDRLPQREVRTGSAARMGPFVAGIHGGAGVLNDGKTPNMLTLRVINNLDRPIRLRGDGDEATRFHLGFERGVPNAQWGLVRSKGDRVTLTGVLDGPRPERPAKAGKPLDEARVDAEAEEMAALAKLNALESTTMVGALIDTLRASAELLLKNTRDLVIDARAAEEEARGQSDTPKLLPGPGLAGVWMIDHHTLRATQETVWAPGDYLDLVLQIHSAALPGQAQLVLTYENLPGHDDGDLVLLLDLGGLKNTDTALQGVKPLHLYGSEAAIEFHAEELGIKDQGTGAFIRVSRTDDTDDQLNIDATAGVWIGPDGAPAHSTALTVNGDLEVTGQSQFHNVGEFHETAFFRQDVTVDGQLTAQGDVANKHGLVVPVGTIVMWSNYDDKGIPDGWKLCDGKAGRPDLRGRFVVGHAPGGVHNKHARRISNSDYDDIGDFGGIDKFELKNRHMPNHRHFGTTAPAGKHSHSLDGKFTGGTSFAGSSNFSESSGKSSHTDSDGVHQHNFWTDYTGGGESHENRPPYYVLAFIIKVE